MMRPSRLAPGLREIDDLLEAQDRELPVELRGPFLGRVVGRSPEPGLQFGQREIGDRPVVGMVFAIHDQRLQHGFRIAGIGEVGQIFGGTAVGDGRPRYLHEHAGHGPLARRDRGIARRELRDVGVVAEPGIVAGDQDAILGEMQIFLEGIGAEGSRHVVGRQRLLGHEARQAAVPQHQGRFPVQRQQRLDVPCGGGFRRTAEQHREGGDRDRAGHCARVDELVEHVFFPADQLAGRHTAGEAWHSYASAMTIA